MQTEHRQAMLAPISEVSAYLQENIGQKLTAKAIGIKDHKSIGHYIRGRKPRDPETEKRLRALYQIVLFLQEIGSSEVIRAWMISANPDMEDLSPVDLLNQGQVSQVLQSAREFASQGSSN